MKPPRLALAAVLGMILLAGCVDIAGVESTTSVGADGSGHWTLAVGIKPDPKSDSALDCGSDTTDMPPGTTVHQENRGEQVWCIYDMPFADVAGLRAAYEGLLKDVVKVHCLDYSGAKLIYDVELVFDQPLGTSVPWRVEAPGLIESNNGSESDASSVTWSITQSTRMLINTDGGDLRPSDALSLSVLVNEDGTGSGTLRVPLVGDNERNQAAAAALSDAGWKVAGPLSPGPGVDRMEARWAWSDEAGFSGMFAALPGVDGTTRGLSLTLAQDDATGQTEYRFEGALYFTDYVATWQGFWPDHEAPPFQLDYLPPGVTETVVGRWTDPGLLEYVWTPDSSTGPIALQAVSVVQPETETQVDDATRQANIDYILQRYQNAIPQGQIVQDPTALQQTLSAIFGPGTANNMTNWTTFACGDYQTRVLSVLDSIRTSDNDAVRAHMAGLDYGPIQAYRGGHQAVVLFPRGTDWRKTGIVLDPWPNQKPETKPIADWMKRFSWGQGPGEGASDYPHLFGNPPHYSGTRLPASRMHPRRIGVNSPVSVMIVAADGRRLGMDSNGDFVVEIEGADFYPTPKGSGEYQWYAGLPEGEYQVTFTGTADGNAHILVGDENGNVVTYGPQPMTSGETASLVLNDTPIEDEALQTASGPVEPILLTEKNAGTVDLGQPVETSSRPDWLTAQNVGRGLAGAGLLLLCLVALAAIGFGLWPAIRRRRG